MLQLESNLGFESQHILHFVTQQNVRRWIALSEGVGGTLGWHCTHERKEAMCLQMRECLRIGNIGLSKQLFSNTLSDVNVIKNIEEELLRFSVITEPSKTPFGKVRKTFSGKIGGQQDDLAIVMQMCISGLRVFYTGEKYQQFFNEY